MMHCIGTGLGLETNAGKRMMMFTGMTCYRHIELGAVIELKGGLCCIGVHLQAVERRAQARGMAQGSRFATQKIGRIIGDRFFPFGA